jgi:predicted phosphoadenosine phosphosulfate sulfurtransferase
MYDKRINPMWFQMPMVITNNASSYERYSYCWDSKEQENWIHEQDPISLKENKYGTERFHELFEAIFKVEFAGIKSCYLSGVRTEESPKRFVSLTNEATYKWITWGKKLLKKDEHYTFYPIYDWNHTDVWTYIFKNKISYNRVYDEMYRKGVSITDMRISNLHHETAMQNLMLVQDIEPSTWNKLAKRIDGANTIKHIQNNSFECPKELPYMFANWKEYADHLIENIIQEEKYKIQLRKLIEKKTTKFYNDELIQKAFYRKIIDTILSSDWDFTKFNNWEMGASVYGYRKFKQGKRDKLMLQDTKYFTVEQINEIIKAISI